MANFLWNNLRQKSYNFQFNFQFFSSRDQQKKKNERENFLNEKLQTGENQLFAFD